LELTLATTFLGFLKGRTHSSSTFITTVSNIAFVFTTNISSEEDCNLGA
jgi:hypothetical protein